MVKTDDTGLTNASLTSVFLAKRTDEPPYPIRLTFRPITRFKGKACGKCYTVWLYLQI